MIFDWLLREKLHLLVLFGVFCEVYIEWTWNVQSTKLIIWVNMECMLLSKKVDWPTFGFYNSVN